MDYGDLEENLNLTIEELYSGLTSLSTITRSNPTPDELADRLQLMADDICRHWPTCRAAHGLDPAPAPHPPNKR
jgi:hypothetical protein